MCHKAIGTAVLALAFAVLPLAAQAQAVLIPQQAVEKPPAKAFPEYPEAGEDPTPMADLRAGNDPDMRFALIGPKQGIAAPAKGYKLLLVLPGGDGGPDFNPFIRRVARNALDPTYLVAEMVAPVWSEGQANQLVWPTGKNPWKGMRFTTEAFLFQVIAEVKKRYPLDDRYIFALGWSSGGPPVYSSALSENTPLTGAFVAMSIFKSSALPGGEAKGRAFYLLHSPTDFIPIAQAKVAQTWLTGHGAKATLTTYQGGHGWTEDPYGHIRRGIAWLEANAVP